MMEESGSHFDPEIMRIAEELRYDLIAESLKPTA